MKYRTTIEYAKDHSQWHFDPERRSIDFKPLGNLLPIPSEELLLFISLLEKKQMLYEVTLQKRLLTYGTQSLTEEDELLNWGYKNDISFMHHFDIDLNNPNVEHPSFFNEINELCGLANTELVLMIQYPGQILPMHCDFYNSYKKRHPNSQIKNIKRFLVALNDWDWGHYFLCGNSVWHQWRNGDYITWDYLVYHGSANCGRKPKITLSITGT